MITTTTTTKTEEQKYSEWCTQHPEFDNPNWGMPYVNNGGITLPFTPPQPDTPKNKGGRKPKGDLSSSPYLWVTINPAPQYWDKFDQVTSIFQRITKNKPIKAIIYCFEQEGITEGDYPHPHIHALICRAQAPSVVSNMIHTNMDRFCGDHPDKSIHIVPVAPADCKCKMSYMKGHKKGKSKKGVDKSLMVLNDVPFRLLHKYQPLYGEETSF